MQRRQRRTSYKNKQHPFRDVIPKECSSPIASTPLRSLPVKSKGVTNSNEQEGKFSKLNMSKQARLTSRKVLSHDSGPIKACKEKPIPSVENATSNKEFSSFHLFNSGIASSRDEIMFTLVAEKLGIEIAAHIASKLDWKCERPLRALRALLGKKR